MFFCILELNSFMYVYILFYWYYLQIILFIIYLRTDCNRDINLFKKDDQVFAFFRKSLDSRMKQLTNEGVGTHVKRADPVLLSDEQLWGSGVFDAVTGVGLSNIVFFLQL